MDELFNVYFIYPDGSNTKERETIPGEAAFKFAFQATKRPAALIGMLREVMITDMGDCCVFLWKYGEGVVFPPNTQSERNEN
jgi:hypothetical protein